MNKKRREQSTWPPGRSEGWRQTILLNTLYRSLERDLERSRADHISEMENMMEKHKQTISENKKKQWVSCQSVCELL